MLAISPESALCQVLVFRILMACPCESELWLTAVAEVLMHAQTWRLRSGKRKQHGPALTRTSPRPTWREAMTLQQPARRQASSMAWSQASESAATSTRKGGRCSSWPASSLQLTGAALLLSFCYLVHPCTDAVEAVDS